MSFTHLRICSQSSQFYHSVLSLWSTNFCLSHSSRCDTRHFFLTFLHNSIWLDVSIWKKWSLAACICRQCLKAEDGLLWGEFRRFLIGRKTANILLPWKGAWAVVAAEEFEEKKMQQFWFLKKEKSMAACHSYNGAGPHHLPLVNSPHVLPLVFRGR